ncbi:hypothetical protein [Embleya scabrispora]|uniref:hypothetical protein n=1 Tax=Embleya scabrispora TaxID=159449 RepID=UPI000379755F|nr:hypothetical protein [Embleya scabrispora]MYS86481.1 hypothetical protein [Streptomyces sp. SID5474]
MSDMPTAADGAHPPRGASTSGPIESENEHEQPPGNRAMATTGARPEAIPGGDAIATTPDAAEIRTPAGPETPEVPTRVGLYGPLPFIPPPDQQRRNARRHLLAAAGGVLAILALLASLAVGGVFDTPSSPAAAPIAEQNGAETSAKTEEKVPVTRIAVSDVAFLTDNRTQALKAGNADAFVAGIDPAATELVTAQRRLFANLRLFPFTSVEFRPPTTFIDPGTDAGPLTRDVFVVFAHQVTGVDSEPIAERYIWTVHRASVGAPLVITKIVGASTSGGGNAYPAPWDEGELALIERPHVLLAVPVKNKAKAAAWADRAESALKKNLAVWKGPAITPQRYVVYVTPDHDTFTRALSGNDLPNVTGVCRTMPPARPIGRDQPMAGSRITLDGSDTMFTKSDGEQQSHLMRHELGHAMVAEFERGGDGPPLWVSEGFAEYLAWTDLSLAEWFQPDARDQVRAGKFSGKLPTDTEVNSPDAKTSTVGYHYSMLAIRYIAEKYGAAKADTFVVAVYKNSAPAALDAALKEATGLDRDTFESNWAKYVRTKVGN